MEVRTRKPVLKPLQEKKKERPPHPPLSPPTLRCRCKRRLPATQAHTWSVLHTQDRKGGVGRRAQETSPFCIQLPERLCKKPGAGLHPQEARAMAESFSVLGCGSTCPPLAPPPRGAGKTPGSAGLLAPSNQDVAAVGEEAAGEREGGGVRQWLDEWRGAGEKGGGGCGRGG